MKKLFWILLCSVCAIAQNVPRSVPTVADLVASPPETFAASPSFGSTNFTAIVTTSGDTASGDGRKMWLWNGLSTAATNTAANGGPIAYPYGSPAGRWIRVLDSASTTDEVVLPTMDALVSLAQGGNLPGAVFLKEYYAGSTNQGSGRWILDTTSTLETNLAIVATPWGSASGRYLPNFSSDEIDPRRLGARNGYVVQAELEQAIAMAESGIWPRTVKIPGGVWKTTNTLVLNGAINSHLVGVGRARTAANTFDGGTLIEMQTDNTKIISIGGWNGVLKNLSLMTKNYQASGNTNSIGIGAEANTDIIMWTIDNIGLEKMACPWFMPNDSGRFVNNIVGNIHILSFSCQGAYFGRGGTMNLFPWWYIQDWVGVAPIYTTVTNLIKAGTQITLQTSGGIVNGATTNSYIQLADFQSTYNVLAVIRAISGNDVIIDLASDPGVAVTDTVGRFFFFPQPITRSAVVFNPGIEADCSAWDIEHIQAPNGVMIENWSELLRISGLHLENVYSSSGPMKYIWNRGGAINISMLGIVNSGAITSGDNTFIYNDVSSGIMGGVNIGSIWMRDYATNGQAVRMAGKETTAPPVIIQSATPRLTLRANATSRVPLSDAVQPVWNQSPGWADEWATASPAVLKVAGRTVMSLVSSNEFQLGEVGNTNLAAFSFIHSQAQNTRGVITPYTWDSRAQDNANVGSTYRVQNASSTPGVFQVGNGTTSGSGLRVGGSESATFSRFTYLSTPLTNGFAFIAYTGARAASVPVPGYIMSATNSAMGSLTAFPTAGSGITVNSTNPGDTNTVGVVVVTN